MGYIYLSYIVLLAALIFIECLKKGQKKWWAVLVLLFPPIAPVVLFKTREKSGIALIALSVISLILVLGTEWFMYDRNQKKKAEDSIPPILKEILALNEDVKKTTIDIYNASGKLVGLSMVQSRVTDLKTTIGHIQEMRRLIDENVESIQRLIAFSEEHQTYFYRKNLDWIFAIRDFYTDPNVVNHHKSRDNYFAAFENMVAYTYDNFDNIMELKSTKHMKTYDIYYMRYRRAADSHNRFNRKRIAFQKQFMEDYPEVKPFLPGSHHLEPFKFWDKFNF